jgi:hypothetical protein
MTTRYTSPDTEIAAALASLGIGTDTYGPTLNTAASPAGVETLGVALAAALREHRIEAVAIWSTPDEAVLAHIVARELGAGVCHVDEVLGLVTLRPGIGPEARTALIATAWPEPARLATLRGVVGNHRARPAVVAAVVSTPVLRSVTDLPTAHLAAEVEPA